ncbi:TonB-dependent receptor [Membranihabitans marinus]|uniref:TonB-dependent receptor n=1 Tax=Membranihabitans marinus TaxID=1227546 RepID=UPI001F2FD34E|nr:TonB-dependent receptor [Membranihabitans marinus]
MKKWILLISMITMITYAQAQVTVSGSVSSVEDGPLIGATVQLKGTSKGSTTDFDGKFSIEVESLQGVLVFSYIGYQMQEVAIDGNANIDVVMVQGQTLDQIVVLGTRAPARTNTESPVPVDILNVADLSLSAPQSELNQLLHYSAPSFNSNTQTISDGTDHVDPASLRGLGPDQVLVLLNGKRRHTSSLINVNGTFGRGNVGTDLNAIPSDALSTIEVLRDGAAAQYGSDAIAGVINLNLKRTVNKLAVRVNTGANFTSESSPAKDIDGETFGIGINYGVPLTKDGGFINFTGSFDQRGWTNRMQEFEGNILNAYNAIEWQAYNDGYDLTQLPNDISAIQQFGSQVSHFSTVLKNGISSATSIGDLQSLLSADVTDAELATRGQVRSDYNMRVGQSALRGGKFFANLELPVGDDFAFYSFGGIGYRRGESGCFFRLPNNVNVYTPSFVNGYLPLINSNIIDKSISTGIRGVTGGWNVDISNTYGANTFEYEITNTHNATLESGSPSEFNAGGHTFSQNTANIDLSRYLELESMKGINIAIGAEYRWENYLLNSGTELSWGNYDVNGNLVNPTTDNSLLVTNFFGSTRSAGCQCFAGFLPDNFIDANRSSVAGYVDVELDVSDAFLITGAIRTEDYSDFGSTFNYKVASRLKASDNISIRGAISTGFRAPSLHQIYFSRTSTIFEQVGGVNTAQEVGTFANTSRAAKLLGIPELKEETSQNFSLGFTAKAPDLGLKFTVDGYLINIDDRVVYTGQFSAGDDEELRSIFAQAGADRAAFFTNAIDTKTTGLDVVVSHKVYFPSGVSLSNDLAATFSKTTQEGDIKASELLREKGLVSTYFDEASRIYLEEAVPRVKLSLNNGLSVDKWHFYLRNTFFGETTEATNEENPQVYSGKVVTDLSIGYAIAANVNLTVGANNLLDVYPDKSRDEYLSDGRFIYSRRSPQFGTNGRFAFARLSFTID